MFASPNVAAIFKLGLLLSVAFALWLATAMLIYAHTMGPKMPVSAATFLGDIFQTKDGWRLVGFGVGAGLIFAFAVLSISVVSFPLLSIGEFLRPRRSLPPSKPCRRARGQFWHGALLSPHPWLWRWRRFWSG